MVTPFTDPRDGDAENLIYFVLSGLIARPTPPADPLNSTHSTSRAGRDLAVRHFIDKLKLCFTLLCKPVDRKILLVVKVSVCSPKQIEGRLSCALIVVTLFKNAKRVF
jgi:hypothetical protein